MKKIDSSLLGALLLSLLSLMIYAMQIIVFNAPRDTLFYLVQDFAFLPLQVAIVTVVLGRYLKRREKTERLRKMSMVINAFFSEAGTGVLKNLLAFSENYDEISRKLSIQADWTDSMLSQTERELGKIDSRIACSARQLEELKELMKNKRDFMIRMIENPNLLEHDTFTDMLLAVFHIAEELISRDGFDESSREDMAHLSNDIQRALKALLVQWVEYMRHLRSEYPYLYALEVRRNPFCHQYAHRDPKPIY